MFNLFSFGRRDYNKGLISVMGVFHKTIRKANNLMSKMEKEVNSNLKKISTLQERNTQIQNVHRETKNFVENLGKFLNA